MPVGIGIALRHFSCSELRGAKFCQDFVRCLNRNLRASEPTAAPRLGTRLDGSAARCRICLPPRNDAGASGAARRRTRSRVFGQAPQAAFRPGAKRRDRQGHEGPESGAMFSRDPADSPPHGWYGKALATSQHHQTSSAHRATTTTILTLSAASVPAARSAPRGNHPPCGTPQNNAPALRIITRGQARPPSAATFMTDQLPGHRYLSGGA